jgi:hypothetical protein
MSICSASNSFVPTCLLNTSWYAPLKSIEYLAPSSFVRFVPQGFGMVCGGAFLFRGIKRLSHAPENERFSEERRRCSEAFKCVAVGIGLAALSIFALHLSK